MQCRFLRPQCRQAIRDGSGCQQCPGGKGDPGLLKTYIFQNIPQQYRGGKRGSGLLKTHIFQNIHQQNLGGKERPRAAKNYYIFQNICQQYLGGKGGPGLLKNSRILEYTL